MLAAIQTRFETKTKENLTDPVSIRHYHIPQMNLSALEGKKIQVDSSAVPFLDLQKEMENVQKELDAIRTELKSTVEPELFIVQVERAVLSAIQNEAIREISDALAAIKLDQINPLPCTLDPEKLNPYKATIDNGNARIKEINTRSENLSARHKEIKRQIDLLEARAEEFTRKKAQLETRQKAAQTCIQALHL